MKRIYRAFVVMILCVSSIIILSACNAKIESARVKSGTISTTIAKGEELNTNDLIVIFNYSDGKTVEVPASELEIGNIDTSTQGTKKLTIAYGKYSFDIDITVVPTEADVSTITSLTSNLLTDFKANRKEQVNKQEEFIDKNKTLVVGDDNAVNFRIYATGIDGRGELVDNITKVRTDIKVELKNGDNYSELIGDELLNMATIDTEKSEIDFTESAIGNQFRITVSATNADEDYREQCSFSTELIVIDAYNVYTARDLSVYDNYHNSYNSIRPTNESVKGIVLLDDINITRDVVRQDMFWTGNEPSFSTYNSYTDQELKGSPYDEYNDGIYRRSFNNGDQFVMKGNYFSINLSEFPRMVVEGTGDIDPNEVVNTEKGKEKYMTGHLVVFQNELQDGVSPSIKSDVLWEDLSFIGNGELNANPINSGSITLSKFYRVDSTIRNTVTHNFYMIHKMEKGEANNEYEGNYLLEKNKGFNSYQCLLYSWGSKNLKIIDCEYKNAGGPAIIADHVGHDKNGNGGYPSHINIINSKIESKVSGKEPWFTVYGASSLVGQLLETEQMYSGLSYDSESEEWKPNGLPMSGKSIVSSVVNGNVNQLNLIVAMKSGSAEATTTDRIDGYVRIFDSMEDYNKYYNEENPEMTTYGLDMDLDNTLMNEAFGKAVYLQSNGNGGYINSAFDGENNRKSSFLEGTAKASVLAEVLTQGIKAMAEANSAYEPFVAIVSDALDEFDEMSLEEKKTALCGLIDTIAGLDEAYQPINILQAIYGGGLENSDPASGFKPFSAIDNEILADLELLQEELKAQINNYEDKSYAVGNYINIYIYNGMGAIIGLYDANNK